MKRIVTITDALYRGQVVRLAASLRRIHPEAELVVYCESEAAAAALGLWPNVRPRPLPAIGSRGAKRAKFEAYADAAREGPFLYLDADVLVLEPIDELFRIEEFAACPDDLSDCAFIENKRRPWAAEPELENRLYINSGVFFAGARFLPRLSELEQLARDDSTWARYTIAGHLYDNHFLCAWLNRWSTPVARLDAEIYNWQGLRMGRKSRVARIGDHLIGPEPECKRLKLAHFAGTGDVDRFLASVPADVGALLARAGTPPEIETTNPVVPALAALASRLADPSADRSCLTALAACLGEIAHPDPAFIGPPWRRRGSFFHDPETLRHLLGSTPATADRWNGLACGGAYLEGDEYDFLRRVVTATHTSRVIEAGAGETTVLFRRLGCKVIAFDPASGPWLERARASGATVIETAADENGFDAAALDSAPSKDAIDLVFIDSPPGGARRRVVLRQFVSRFRPRYVVVHDAWRDLRDLLPECIVLRLRPVATFGSTRGLVLLATDDGREVVVPSPTAMSRIEAADAASIRLTVTAPPTAVPAGAHFSVRLAIASNSGKSLGDDPRMPVRAAYHWLRGDGSAEVYDGERTCLPFVIHPGDEAEFDVQVKAPPAAGQFGLLVDLVQESVRWFGCATAPQCQVECLAAMDTAS